MTQFTKVDIKTPKQEADELIDKLGKEKAIKRAADIVSAASLRNFIGTSDKVIHWRKVLDILIES